MTFLEKRKEDVEAIEQLKTQVDGLTSAILTFTKMHGEGKSVDAQNQVNDTKAPSAPVAHSHPNPDFQAIQDLLEDERYEKALIKLIQLPAQSQAFDEVLVRYNGAAAKVIESMNDLICLSPIVALSVSLETFWRPGLSGSSEHWLVSRETLRILRFLAKWGKIMDLLFQQLQMFWDTAAAAGVEVPRNRLTKMRNIAN